MKVQVNEDKCEGHAKCQASAPEVFEVRDDVSHLLLDEIPEDLLPKVDRAIRLCPRQAISWANESS
jgi:ferredoxin